MKPAFLSQIFNEVAIVVVLFQPTEANVENAVRLAKAGFSIIAVSNGVTAAQRDALMATMRVTLIENCDNLGLARALNQGVDAALTTGANYVMLLDQDSEPCTAMIERLYTFAGSRLAGGERVACVAPRLIDRKAPDASVGAAGEPQTVATSGSLLPRQAIVDVGPMWEDLFIDGIDHEWCFRAQAAGLHILVDREATLAHDMGDAGVRVGQRYRPIHRSAFRHYHIVRNILWLQRLSYIPLTWRLRELAKLGYRIPVYVLVSRERISTIGSLFRAFRDGVAGPDSMPAKAMVLV